MDRLTIKVLKLIQKQGKPIHEATIVEKFGDEARSSLEYLKGIEYIHEGSEIQGMYYDSNENRMRPEIVPNGVFEIRPAGKDFLQSSPGVNFDRWITRICAIVGAVTGIAALIWEIIDHLTAA